MTGIPVALVQAALIAYLPGAALFRLPFWQRDRRASLDAEERVFWHVQLSVAWSLTVVLALASVGRYQFTLLLGINALVTLVMLGLSGRRLSYAGMAKRPSWTIVIPMALIALGCWRFFPAFEYIIGGKDPGVYVNEGVQIAQRGSLVIRDVAIAEVPQFAQPLFFPPAAGDDTLGAMQMGMFVRDPDRGMVIGQFPQLFPASIAIGYGLYAGNGLTGARETTVFWALLGVLSVYFMAARWTGRPAAAAAAVLLSVHVAQVWFARSPNSDMVMQAALFTTALALARAMEDDDRFFGPIAAWILTLQLFSRVESLLAVLVSAIAIPLSWIATPGRRLRWTFLVPVAAGTWLGLQYLTTLMASYFWRPLEYLGKLPRVPLQVAITVGLALLLLMSLRRERFGPLVRRWLPVVVAAVIFVLAVYGYFFRHAEGKLAAHDADSVRTFIDLYLWWPMAVAAVCGLALSVREDFWRAPAFILMWAAFALFLLYKINVVPEHFWLARRFVPIILPGALVLACRALFGRTPGTARAIAATAIVLIVGARYAAASAPLAGHIEYRGLIPYIEKLANRFTERDLIIMESRGSSDVHVVGLPLAYIYAKPVLILRSPKPDLVRLKAFLEEALKKYDHVFFIGTGGTSLLTTELIATPIDSDRVQVPEFEVTRDRLPQGRRYKEFDYGVYELTIGHKPRGPFTLDVGVRDDLLVAGFNAKEEHDGRTVRWTQDGSEVSVPGLTGAERTIVLVMSDGGRPASAGPARVRVLFDSVIIGETAVEGRGFQSYEFALPAALAESAGRSDLPVPLRLESTVWSPAGHGGTDTRQLGVMLDTVTVR
jgi:hypothetical protein